MSKQCACKRDSGRFQQNSFSATTTCHVPPLAVTQATVDLRQLFVALVAARRSIDSSAAYQRPGDPRAMLPGQFRLLWVLAATLPVYLLTIGVMLRWHWALGPPHTQATLSLMIALGLCAALLGLSSIQVAAAALHWTRRASALIAGVALMSLLFNPFFEWDGFLISQLLLMFGVQTACVAVALLAARSLGYGLAFKDAGGQWHGKPWSNKALQFSIFDILLFTAAVAFLFAAMRGSQLFTLGWLVFALNIAGGCAAATVGLTVLWACLGSSPVFLRAPAPILIAPMGGVVYVLAERYAPLLFSWQWYAGVTSAQVLFMTIPCLLLRAHGFRFLSMNRPDK